MLHKCTCRPTTCAITVHHITDDCAAGKFGGVDLVITFQRLGFGDIVRGRDDRRHEAWGVFGRFHSTLVLPRDALVKLTAVARWISLVGIDIGKNVSVMRLTAPQGHGVDWMGFRVENVTATTNHTLAGLACPFAICHRRPDDAAKTSAIVQEIAGIEQQVEIFGRFRQKERFHAVLLLMALHVAYGRVPARRFSAVFDAFQHIFSDLEQERIAGRTVQERCHQSRLLQQKRAFDQILVVRIHSGTDASVLRNPASGLHVDVIPVQPDGRPVVVQ
uniref:Uncharacterized protein n=1 Tax=Anopheles atroparvus TaxID=41427 RepID=A0A182JJB6_ANOAO